MKAGVVPAPRPTWRLRAVGSTGSPLPAEGFEWVYEQFARRRGSSRRAAAPTCARRSWAAARCCRCTRASCRRAASARRWRRGDEDGRPLIGRGRRARDHPADALDADLLLERPGRRALPRRATSRCSRACGATATGSRSPTRGTAVIYGRSDSTINRGGRAHGHERDLQRGRGRRRGARQPGRGRRGRQMMPVRRACATGSARRRARGRDPAPRARALLAAARARRIVQIAEVPRTLSGKKLEVPVKKILLGPRPRARRSRDSLANPAALDFFAEFARRAELSSSSSSLDELDAASSASASVVLLEAVVVPSNVTEGRPRRRGRVAVARLAVDERVGVDLPDQLRMRPDGQERPLLLRQPRARRCRRCPRSGRPSRSGSNCLRWFLRNARIPCDLAFWAPVKTTCTPKRSRSVSRSASRSTTPTPDALSLSPWRGGGEGDVEHERDVDDQHHRRQELHDGEREAAHAAHAQDAHGEQDDHRDEHLPERPGTGGTAVVVGDQDAARPVMSRSPKETTFCDARLPSSRRVVGVMPDGRGT